MANIDIIRGRSTALLLTNQTGATANPGDVVVIDTAHTESFVTSTTSNTVVPLGVVDETIGISSNGRVVVSGYARAVKTLGSTTRGDYLYQSTTAATAANMAGAAIPGAFAYVETAGSGTATTAYVFPPQRGITSIAVSSNTLTGPVSLVAQGSVGITTSGSAIQINAVAGSGGGGGSSDLAGKELDYVQITTSVTVSGTTEGAATTVITGNSVAYDGATIIEVHFFAPYCQLSGASSQLFVLLYEDSTVLGRLDFMTGPAGIAYPGLNGRLRRTPSNASHTYTVKAHSSDGLATINCGSGGSGSQLPAYLRITRVSS